VITRWVGFQFLWHSVARVVGAKGTKPGRRQQQAGGNGPEEERRSRNHVMGGQRGTGTPGLMHGLELGNSRKAHLSFRTRGVAVDIHTRQVF
jgi:hypothetical protein